MCICHCCASSFRIVENNPDAYRDPWMGINFRPHDPADTIYPLLIWYSDHKIFSHHALFLEKIVPLPSSEYTLYCGCLAVNNVIREDIVLRQWLFNLKVPSASRESSISGQNQFQSNIISFLGWAQWNIFLSILNTPPLLPLFCSVSVSQGRLVWFILTTDLIPHTAEDDFSLTENSSRWTDRLDWLNIINRVCKPGEFSNISVSFSEQNIWYQMFLYSTVEQNRNSTLCSLIVQQSQFALNQFNQNFNDLVLVFYTTVCVNRYKTWGLDCKMPQANIMKSFSWSLILTSIRASDPPTWLGIDTFMILCVSVSVSASCFSTRYKESQLYRIAGVQYEILIPAWLYPFL